MEADSDDPYGAAAQLIVDEAHEGLWRVWKTSSGSLLRVNPDIIRISLAQCSSVPLHITEGDD